MKTSPDRLFKAVSDPTRLRILRLLSDGELCVCDLTRTLRAGQSKVSRHLAYLKRSGLVVGRDDGRWSYYTLARPQEELHKRLLACVRAAPLQARRRSCS